MMIWKMDIMMFAERKKNIYMRLCVAHNNKVLDKEEKYKGLDDGYIGRPRKQEIMKFLTCYLKMYVRERIGTVRG